LFEDADILENLSWKEKCSVRKTIIDMILSTDMKQHFRFFLLFIITFLVAALRSQFEQRVKTIKTSPFKPDEEEIDYKIMMQLLIMICDISNGCNF
jgi:hypothetical protein